MRSGRLRPVWWWACPLLLAAVALTFDAADRRIPFGVWTTGPVDEVAHLSTAALGLLVLVRFIDAPRRFDVAALIASVAIDVDHIPPYFGSWGTRASAPSRIRCPPWPCSSLPRRPAAGTGPCWPGW